MRHAPLRRYDWGNARPCSSVGYVNSLLMLGFHSNAQFHQFGEIELFFWELSTESNSTEIATATPPLKREMTVVLYLQKIMTPVEKHQEKA